MSRPTLGYLVETRRLGDFVLPTSAEAEAELEQLQTPGLVPYSAVEALAMVANVFPAARVESLTIKRERR